jgi:hypothetical protein
MSSNSSNFDSNIKIRCWTLIIAIGIAIAIEYVAFEVYSIPTPIPIPNPSFHVIVIIRIAGMIFDRLSFFAYIIF